MSIATNVMLTKHICLLHSIQKNPSTMADNDHASSCYHVCQLGIGFCSIFATLPKMHKARCIAFLVWNSMSALVRLWLCNVT